MDISDVYFGKLLLIGSLSFFAYLFIWLTVLPVLDLEEESFLYHLFPDHQLIFIVSELWGLCFVGTLMVFTYLHHTESKKRTNMIDMSKWIIVGISGVTCGGKTTLANNLKEVLRPVYVMNQDNYFYPDNSPQHVPVAGLTVPHHNYDILSALDMGRMLKDTLSILGGDHKKAHAAETTIREDSITAKGKKFLLIEGFTVLNYKPIADLCHLKFYLVLTFEECLNRRLLRLYDPPDVEGYFEKCVWPEHLKYRDEIEKDNSVLQLSGVAGDAFTTVVQIITSYIDEDPPNK